MLWIKAIHVIFMVTWFAALFYLPRLFAYHTEVTDEAGHARFCLMEKRLFLIGSIGMVGTLVFGFWLFTYWLGAKAGWLHAKTALALLLVGYHHWLIVFMKAFREKRNQKSAKFFKIVNEIPALFLVAMVILVIVKPF
jgi:putative membrane protein